MPNHSDRKSSKGPAESSSELLDRRPRSRRILSYGQLQTEKGIRFSRQWILALQKAGKFPRSVALGSASTGFVEYEIDAWIDGLIEARDEKVVA
jgi:predicted DNA-binding transcriptional regulator AlpA